MNMAELRALIADAIDVEEDEITPDAHFVNDIGVDSLGSLEVLVRLERELGIKIPESDLPRLVSLQQVMSYLSETAGK
jgi:acyl carrier protein